VLSSFQAGQPTAAVKGRILNLRIVGRDLPGIRFTKSQGALVHREPVYVGIQKKDEVIELFRGDAPQAVFNFSVEAIPDSKNGYDFRGPFVHGRKGDRFLYLSWGVVDKKGSFEMFRRAKIRFDGIDKRDLKRALSNSNRLVEGTIALTEGGGPLCGSYDSRRLKWRVRSVV
jgi:Family of unknown function (DUF5990)